MSPIRTRLPVSIIGLLVLSGPGGLAQERARNGPDLAELRRVITVDKHAGAEEERRAALARLEAWTGGDGAGAILAELEAIDLRLRLGELEGLDARLERLEAGWVDSPSIGLRARALRGLLRGRLALLPEPNAVAEVDVGARFTERFLVEEEAPPRSIPLGFPVRFLNDLALLRADAAGSPRPTVILALADYRDLLEAERATRDGAESLPPLARAAELARRTGSVLVLIVFTGSLPALEWDVEREPWDAVCILSIAGTFRELSGVPRRTRFEWVSGTTFLRLGPGNTIVDWRLPWDAWKGFEERWMRPREADGSRG